MSSTSIPTDFSDLYTDVLQSVRGDTTSTTATNIAKRLINKALHDFHIQHDWPWAERRARIVTHKPYTTGTVTIDPSSSRTAVTGSGTAWNTAVTGYGFNNVRAGGKLLFSGSSEIYTVSSVSSDTALTLTETFALEDGLSGATYTYFEDEYALASDFWRLVDAREFSYDMDLPCVSREEFYRRAPGNYRTGRPQAVTIVDLAPSSSTAAQPRVLFTPAPYEYISIPYRYITTHLAVSSAGAGQTNLSASDDEPIVPLRYRHALVLYAISHWYRDRKDDARSQEAETQYVDLVRRIAGDYAPERNTAKLTRRRTPYGMTRGNGLSRAGFDALADR